MSDPADLRALRNLIRRLDEVHNDPAYIGVWATSQVHIGPYKGPTYTRELAEARAALEAARFTDDERLDLLVMIRAAGDEEKRMRRAVAIGLAESIKRGRELVLKMLNPEGREGIKRP